MSVAARTMGWQRRMRNTPGPLAAPPGGSGESPNGLLTVELFLGGWVDITALGLVRYANRVQITKGQPDEATAVNPGTCTMTLDNRDGRFTPRNPLGPYYGVIGRNTPIRVSVQSGLDRSYRFAGEVPEWPTTWDSTGTDINVPIQASGILRRLSQGSSPLHSPIYLYWVYQVPIDVLFTRPALAYWPCEDGPLSSSIASAIGGPAMAIGGSPLLASNTDFSISDALPAMNGATFSGSVAAYTPAVDPILVGLSDSDVYVTFALSVPSGGETTGAVVCKVASSGSIRTWEVVYTGGAGGTLTLRGKDSTGAIVMTTAPNNVLVDGVPVLATIHLSLSGATTFATMVIMNVGNTANNFQSTSGTGTFGIVSRVTINPGRALTSAAIGHVGVSTFDSTVIALAGFAGERAGDRMSALCAIAGVTYRQVGNTSDTVAMGPRHTGTLLELIRECVDADMGVLFELPDEVGLGYRTHTSLYNQAPALTLDYPSFQLAEVPVPIDDDTFTRNDVTAVRLNGSSYRAQQLTGALNVQQPPGGVGRYDTSVTVNVNTDAETLDQAGWRLHLGTTDEPRYPTVAVQLSHSSITASPTLRIAALAVSPADRITVTNPPAWLPPGDISQLALGWSESIDQFLHAITWNTAPESPWRVAITNDTVYGHAGTDGSLVTQAVNSTATTLLVATTTAGSPLWTTSAGDFPFDVMVGGERVTVTNITGASSPQSFTVVRSVNGVVKPQPANVGLRMYQPAIIAL